jgi:uncharacterized protein YndB with AHSA1/START domain
MSANELRLTRIPSVKVGMLIRRPPNETFQALVDPAITTKFWFSETSGKATPGASIQWTWEVQRLSTKVFVREVDENSRILFDWNDERPTTVEFRFVPWEGDATYVQVTETGFSGDGDEIVSHVAGSTGGFYQVLCALKALLEHDVVLTVVRDQGLVRNSPPEGLEL